MSEHRLPPVILSPEGPYRCGDTVRATWTLTNYSDEEATGGKLRFEVAPGLSTDLARVLTPCDQEQIPMMFGRPGEDGEGAELPTIPPGGTVTVMFPFTIEQVTDQDDLYVQVRISWPSEEPFYSPKSPIKVRLTPRIVPTEPRQGGIKADNQHFALLLGVENVGGVTERDVLVAVPVPPGLRVARPVVPEGVTSEMKNGEVHVRIPDVPAYASVNFGLEFMATDSLQSDIVEIGNIRVESPSSGITHLEPIEIKLDRAVDFSGSKLSVEPTPFVQAGTTVQVRLDVVNNGRSNAKNVDVVVALPEELLYAPGSLKVNGGSDARRDDPASISLATVRAQSTAVIEFDAVVRSPIDNQHEFMVLATIDNDVHLGYDGAIISEPSFPLNENYVEIESAATIESNAQRSVFVRIANVGTEISRQVRVRVHAPDLVIDKAYILSEGQRSVAPIKPILGSGTVASSAIDLGDLAPHEERLIEILVGAPETFGHNDVFPLRAYLRHDGEAEIELGGIEFKGRSHPRISSQSAIRSQRADNLRIGQIRNLSIHLKNDGSDVARNVRVNLDLPTMLTIERVDGADRDGDVIVFREIPARSTAEGTVALRVTGAAGSGIVELHPIVSGERMSTVHLVPLALTTAAQSFIDEVKAEVTPIPESSAIAVTLRFRNVGDGLAHRVLIKAKIPDGYVLNSTNVNGKNLRDIRGISLLSYGLNMPPIAPNQAIEITYSVYLQGQQSLTPSFEIESDDQPPMNVSGTPYKPALQRRFLPELVVPALQSARVTSESMNDRRTEDEGGIQVELDEEILSAEISTLPRKGEQHSIDVDFIDAESHETKDPAESLNDPTVHDGIEVEGSSGNEEPEPQADDIPIEVHEGAEIEVQIEAEAHVAGEAAHDGGLDLESAAPSKTASQNGNGHHPQHGPIALLVLDKPRIERLNTGLKTLLAKDGIGWYRHAFALRLLAPTQLLGVSEEVESAWMATLDAIQADFRMPFMRMAMPNFTPDLKWGEMLENEALIEATGNIMDHLPTAAKSSITLDIDSYASDEVYGKVTTEFDQYFATDDAPSIQHLNRILPELIPSSSERDPELGAALAEYKEITARKFAAMVYYADPAGRHERMLSAPTDEMDEPLTRIAERLASGVWA